jgi:hypothetical protein
MASCSAIGSCIYGQRKILDTPTSGQTSDLGAITGSAATGHWAPPGTERLNLYGVRGRISGLALHILFTTTRLDTGANKHIIYLARQ